MPRLFLLPLMFLSAGAARPAELASFRKIVQPFVAKNCNGCHNAKLKSGEVDLQRFQSIEMLHGNRDLWEKVALKIKSGEMPPKGIPRPPAAEIKAVAAWIEREFERIDANAKPDPGRVTARRLNRVEYNNTVRDLLGVSIRPADDFPVDDAGYGFDNIGDVLSLSPVLMEKYMLAADNMVRAAIRTSVPNYKPTRERVTQDVLLFKDYSKPVIGPLRYSSGFHTDHTFPVEAEYVVRILMAGRRPEAVAGPVRLAFWLDGKQVQSFDMHTGLDKPRQFEARIKIARGVHKLGATIMDSYTTAEPWVREKNVYPDAFEIRGPFNPVPPPLPESHRKLFACHPSGNHGSSCARTIVGSLAERAFRRPVSNGEIERLTGFVQMAQDAGDSFEAGVGVALKAILVSPHFLFRIERDPAPDDPAGPHPIGDFELASRLSYFLWSSMPDDELFRAAREGRLRQHAALQAQIARMLRDPKASALADNFAGQWLELRNLDSVKPDPDRFPQFDADLRDAMRSETRMFFESIVKEDRSILDFINGRYTFLNERLANHYGIKGVEGAEMRRVALDGVQRSGVLTQGSVLTVSSYPTRTSPVLRGKWILENVLAAPPPPPPPGVANLDEQSVGLSGSLRQQMEKHRSNATCASCHARMDPIGFGMENYDAIGAWRDKDGNFPIDASGNLPSGQSFRSSAELKNILLADKAAFTRCLTEKMLTYALGRGLERYDKPAINSISRQVAADGYRFSALVEGIVESLPFQMRRGDNAAARISAAHGGTR